MNYSGSWNENRNFCLHKTPDCLITWHNFNRSIAKSKTSKLKIVKNVALWAEQMIAEGHPPAKVKLIYDFVNKKKGKIFVPKMIKTDDR